MYLLVMLAICCFAISRYMTLTYRGGLANILKASPEVRAEFAKKAGENELNFFLSSADLYQACRTKITFGDIIKRPPSDKHSAAATYFAFLTFFAWWYFSSTVTLIPLIGLVMVVFSYEYVSYWKDTYTRTIKNEYYLEGLKALYDYYKPSNRLG